MQRRFDHIDAKRPLLTFAGHGGYILPDGVVFTFRAPGGYVGHSERGLPSATAIEINPILFPVGCPRLFKCLLGGGDAASPKRQDHGATLPWGGGAKGEDHTEDRLVLRSWSGTSHRVEQRLTAPLAQRPSAPGRRLLTSRILRLAEPSAQRPATQLLRRTPFSGSRP